MEECGFEPNSFIINLLRAHFDHGLEKVQSSTPVERPDQPAVSKPVQAQTRPEEAKIVEGTAPKESRVAQNEPQVTPTMVETSKVPKLGSQQAQKDAEKKIDQKDQEKNLDKKATSSKQDLIPPKIPENKTEPKKIEVQQPQTVLPTQTKLKETPRNNDVENKKAEAAKPEQNLKNQLSKPIERLVEPAPIPSPPKHDEQDEEDPFEQFEKQEIIRKEEIKKKASQRTQNSSSVKDLLGESKKVVEPLHKATPEFSKGNNKPIQGIKVPKDFDADDDDFLDDYKPSVQAKAKPKDDKQKPQKGQDTIPVNDNKEFDDFVDDYIDDAAKPGQQKHVYKVEDSDEELANDALHKMEATGRSVSGFAGFKTSKFGAGEFKNPKQAGKDNFDDDFGNEF